MHGRRLDFCVINVSIKTDTSLPLSLFFTGIRTSFVICLEKELSELRHSSLKLSVFVVLLQMDYRLFIYMLVLLAR
jgi:hypothetical protein